MPSLPSPLPARTGTLLPSASILTGSVHRCPAGSTVLARAPSGYCCRRFLRQRLGSASDLSRPEAPGHREGALLAGAITEWLWDPCWVDKAETRGGCSQVTKTRMHGFSDGRFLLPPPLLFLSQGTAEEIRNCWQLEAVSQQ